MNTVLKLRASHRRLIAKYPYLLLSSMLYEPRSSEAEHPHQLFSARWFVLVRLLRFF